MATNFILFTNVKKVATLFISVNALLSVSVLILFTFVKFARQNTYNKYFTIFVTLTKKLIKFCPVLFALPFDQGNKIFLPQSAGKCISEGLISKIFWGGHAPRPP